MKYLGIDFGTKRIGLAVTDESGTIVRTLDVVKNSPKVIEEIGKIINTEGVESIVVGDSTGSSVAEEIEDFISRLTFSTSLPVDRMNEAFTSFEAHGRLGKEMNNARSAKAPTKPDNLDSRAAAIILERYLMKKNGK